MRTILAASALPCLLAFAAVQKPNAFKIETDDGYTIAGDLAVPKRKEGKAPLVIFIHDAEGKRAPFAEPANKFFRAGFATVTFDLRGHGESTKGKNGRDIEIKDELFKSMRRDLAAVLKHCGDQAGVDTDSLVLIGAGFGATLALKHASNDEAAKAVIVLSPLLADSRTKDDNSKPIEKLAAKPVMVVTGKYPDDKENATRLEFYAKQKGGKLEIKNLPIDNRGADLFTARATLADEMLSWVKKNAIDPAKKPEPPKK
ncbi:MAG: alpha/beta fold hydrolase [Planctomycetes bacterium]|nr:alpha/beta fold hydrolase [Planctomycetota bacterium]